MAVSAPTVVGAIRDVYYAVICFGIGRIPETEDRMKAHPFVHVAALAVAGWMILPTGSASAQQARGLRVDIGKKDIGGVVTSSKGPEAGVWVIAETAETPTRFARIVVTGDQGRFVLPDLPSATYQVFVRGYGLVDSPKQTAKPGQRLDLKAEAAPDDKTAAQVYPAAWWLSMLNLPGDKELQRKFTMDVKECYDCHQLGSRTTRELGAASSPGAISTAVLTLDAWDRRTKVGPSGPSMGTAFQAMGQPRQMFADWTDRIAKGEAPPAPPRPAGIERNLVITEWDWGTPTDGDRKSVV